MITLKTLLNKYSVTKENGDVLPDITRGSINIDRKDELRSSSRVIVDEDTVMRPDLIAVALYNDQSMLDLLLKYNAVSNPFSLYVGQILYAPNADDLAKIVETPSVIKDIGDVQVDETESIFVDPKTDKDKNRLDLLKKQNKGGEVLPSNVNKKGDKNIKIKNGKLVFGEDVTSVNREDCPEPISRANLKKALIKNNLFG
tara:strand:- start:40575 stop:41174 length:600 start_codon:yes stop_codon:yes gene_type:complete